MLPLLYSALTRPLAPLAVAYLAQRRERGKEDPARFRERLGITRAPRPEGPLIWVHAASVGEATAVLGLIEYLLETRPDLEILVTTGTVTSARLLENRLPAGTRPPTIQHRKRADLDGALSRSVASRPGALGRVRVVAKSGIRGACPQYSDGAGQCPALGAFLRPLATLARADRAHTAGIRPVPRPGPSASRTVPIAGRPPSGCHRRSQRRRSRRAVRLLRTIAPARHDRFASNVAGCQHARRRGEGRCASTSRGRRALSRLADAHCSPPSGARRRDRRHAGGAGAADRPARSRRSGHSRHASLSRGYDGRARAVLPPRRDRLHWRFAGRRGWAPPFRR